MKLTGWEAVNLPDLIKRAEMLSEALYQRDSENETKYASRWIAIRLTYGNVQFSAGDGRTIEQNVSIAYGMALQHFGGIEKLPNVCTIEFWRAH